MTDPAVLTASAPRIRAEQPFRFWTALTLRESTGLRASTLPQLVRGLREVPDASIYYHTHHFLLQHHFLAPEPTNDVTYWVQEVLGEATLGELLAGVDTMSYSTLEDLRQALIGVIERYLDGRPAARLRFAGEGEEFFFVKSVHVIMPTLHAVWSLAEFAQALEQVSIRSLYFHLFDARLRVGHGTNDFSKWLEEQLGCHALAEEIRRLDLYTHTLESLRRILLSLVYHTLQRQRDEHAGA